MKTKVLGRVKGADGHNFCVGANVNSVSDLPAAKTVPSGTHYYVGASAPREVYFSDGSQWINQGYMYKRDNDSIGSTYKEKLNFDLSQASEDDNGAVTMFYPSKGTDLPDLIVGSIIIEKENNIVYLSEFKLVVHEVINEMSKGRVFYSDTSMSIGGNSETRSAELAIVTGDIVEEFMQSLEPNSLPTEHPEKVYAIIVHKYYGGDVIKSIDLEAVYCIARQVANEAN